jgi:hypothetical protein
LYTTLKTDSPARTSQKRKQESEEEESMRPLKKHREVTSLHSTSTETIEGNVRLYRWRWFISKVNVQSSNSGWHNCAESTHAFLSTRKAKVFDGLSHCFAVSDFAKKPVFSKCNIPPSELFRMELLWYECFIFVW